MCYESVVFCCKSIDGYENTVCYGGKVGYESIVVCKIQWIIKLDLVMKVNGLWRYSGLCK